MRKFNYVYRKLIKNDADIVGQIAYSLYKKHKGEGRGMATSSIIEPFIITDPEAVKVLEKGFSKKHKSISNKKTAKEVDKMEREGEKLFKRLFLS